MRFLAVGLFGLAASATLAADPPPTVRFERVVIDPDLADAYQVEVADVDGDRKPDIVALGNNAIAWYQNPTWTKRIIGATGAGPLVADIISSATTDLDGDGRAEVAVACDFAMNTPTRGQLYLASQGATPDEPWSLRKVADVPSIHRVRWNYFAGFPGPTLVVAPIFGRGAAPPTYDQDDARVVVYRPDSAQPKTGHWQMDEVMRRPVVHALGVLPEMATNHMSFAGAVFTADNTGLSGAVLVAGPEPTLSRWKPPQLPNVPGLVGPPPKRGCSDFRTVTMRGVPPAIATIEPWHGSELVIWTEQARTTPLPSGKRPMDRTVIDKTLDEGHALWTADVDGDGTDEIFAGHRGRDYRVAMYQYDGKTWNRTILDTAIAAQDLRGGDLDGDGVPDIVAVGGRTHNVVWYRPVRLNRVEPPAGR